MIKFVGLSRFQKVKLIQRVDKLQEQANNTLTMSCSTSALGKGMSVEERRKLKQELKTLQMEDISSFMESLPSDFLTILRTE